MALLMLTAAGARCGTPFAAGDSLCIHFAGESREMHIELVSSVRMNGRLPLTVCSLQRGRTYGLTVGGRGYEQRMGRLSIDMTGEPAVGGTRLRTAGRNMVLPGWGSIRAERPTDGWMDLVALAGTGILYYREEREYRHMENRLEVLQEMIDSASSLEERIRASYSAHETSRELNVQNDHRRRLALAAAYLYGFQLLEPWISGGPPRVDVEAGGSVLRIGSHRSSTAKAALLSLLRPGRGQTYQGKKVRGAVYSLLAVGAGLVALDYHNSYDQAENDYIVNLERFYNASTSSDRELYAERSDRLWSEVEDGRTERNIAYGVLAAIWAMNVADTFIQGGEETPPADLTFEAGPDGAALVYRF